MNKIVTKLKKKIQLSKFTCLTNPKLSGKLATIFFAFSQPRQSILAAIS